MMPIFTLAITLSNQQNPLLTMVQVLYILEVFILAHYYGQPSTETPIAETTLVRCNKYRWIYLTSTYYWWLLRPTITIRFDSKFQIIAQSFIKFGWKIPNHFGKIATKLQRGIFWLTLYITTKARSCCPSVTLVDCDHIGLKSWKLIAQTISPTPSLFVAKMRSTYSQRNMGKFWGEQRSGREKVALWRRKSGNIFETHKNRGKVTMHGL